MEQVRADIKLINGDDFVLHKKGFIVKDKIRELVTSILVVTGAIMMAVNDVIKEQLGLTVVDHRKVQIGRYPDHPIMVQLPLK